MLRHGVEQFTELGRLDEPLPGISLLTRHREMWHVELQFFLLHSEGHHATKQSKITVNGTFVLLPFLLYGAASCLGHPRKAFRIAATLLVAAAVVQSLAQFPERWRDYQEGCRFTTTEAMS